MNHSECVSWVDALTVLPLTGSAECNILGIIGRTTTTHTILFGKHFCEYTTFSTWTQPIRVREADINAGRFIALSCE